MKDFEKQYFRNAKHNLVMRRRTKIVLTALSLVVAVIVTWSLHLTGETTSTITYCGIEEHSHSEECVTKNLKCGTDESDNHTHTDECYEIKYICGFEEEHTHSLACYSNPEADLETASDWENTFADAELTGFYAQDILTIAKTQLGYTESADNYEVSQDKNGNEIKNGYTRYGEWYGNPYGDWCAMFVSFCLYYAGVPAEIFPRDSVCQSWIETLSDPNEGFELYAEAESYSPYPGDLVFFDTDGDGKADRVGIISELFPEYTGTEEYYESDPDYTLTGFMTIEGNSGGKVDECEYDLNAETILGYGTLSLIYSADTISNEDIAAIAETSDGSEEEELSLKMYANLDVTKLDGVTAAIVDNNKTYAMTGDVVSDGSISGMGAAEKSTQYCIWTFEKADPDNAEKAEYYICRIDENGDKRYLVMGNNNSSTKYSLEYANDKTNASVFTLIPYENNNSFYLGTTVVLNNKEINIYLGLKNSNSNKIFRATSGTPGEGDIKSGSRFYLYIISQDKTTITLETESYDSNNSTYTATTVQGYKAVALSDASAIEYTDVSGGHFCLIPISFLEDAFQSYGFVFDEYSSCQFSYHLGDSTTHTAGNYEKYNGEWYLKVKCSKGDEAVICYTILTEATDTITPSSTVIHMFDYWTTESRLDSDNHVSTTDDLNTGINLNHILKFGRDMRNLGAINTSYGGSDTPSKTTQGIVQKLLGTDGYPILSGDTSLGMESTDIYSLSYLFNPYEEAEGKASFSKTTNLLSVDSNGYFYYNSAERYAQLDETSHNFTVYNEPAGVNTSIAGLQYGQFYPFNEAHEVAQLNDMTDPINHYFGMTLTARFIQRNGGYTNEYQNKKPITFEFSGDNDVWIFIDGVLVADLGGLGAARSVKIDFSTGSVTIDDGTDDTPSTTIREAFEAAEMTWDNDGSDTFADNTTHVLKFFYLERGNYDSNLKLKYNLTEIPETSIYKVDQYGAALEGATFAVYKTDESYHYLTDAEEYITLSDNAVIDSSTGTITDGSYTIKPVYIGTTDSNGEMIFSDQDEMPYSLSELQNLFGEYFILREIDVPDGYRTVSDEIYLFIKNGLLQCYDPYETGVWASTNALITAPSDLYPADDDSSSINYYDVESGTTNGTLFSVVLKRNLDNDNNIVAESVTDWSPIYGSDENGYTVLEFGEGKAYTDQISAIIAAAKAAESYGNVLFSPAASGMQLLLENMPGKPTRYYTYMYENKIDFTTTDPQYLVAYYWTSVNIEEDGWDNVSANNTKRIRSHGGTYESEDGSSIISYPAFSIQWGSTIEVPNIENRLFFQKRDEDGNFVNGAVFAMYSVGEDDSQYLYYTGTQVDENGSVIKDESGNAVRRSIYLITSTDGNSGIAGLSCASPGGSYSVDSNTGVITVIIDDEKYLIYPAQNAAGEYLVDETSAADEICNENGTGHFQKLMDGYYILREIRAPTGYAVNTEEIMVLVDGTAVYANAGNPDNGVRVGNGVGYITKTLDVFASEGMIDETLTWIYSMLQVTPSTTFSKIPDISEWRFSKASSKTAAGVADGNDLTYDRSEAMVTYLKYVENSTSALFDYEPNADYSGRTKASSGQYATNTVSGENTLRLYTETGWSALAVYQDYSFGILQTSTYAGNETDTSDVRTNYDDLTNQNLTNLFSNSTFVQITDKSITDLEILKTDESGTASLSGAKFVLYKNVEVLVTEEDESIVAVTVPYYYAGKDSDGNAIWSAAFGGETESEFALTTGDDGIAKFLSITEGTYYLKELEAPAGYQLLTYNVTITMSDGVITATDKNGVAIPSNVESSDSSRYVYTIKIANSSGYELPATGGSGIVRYTANGIILIITAITGMVFCRRRRNRRIKR